jgi:dUTP pyrophosphatase
MVLNPRTMVENGVVSPVEEFQIQQHGIDLRVDDILAPSYAPNEPYMLELGRDETSGDSVRKVHTYSSLPIDDNGWYTLFSGPFQIVMQEYVKIPYDACALVIMRSTLNRAGAPLLSALFDAGYHNKITVSLYPQVQPIRIQRGARVAQIVFFEADSAGAYDGIYQDTKK